MGPPDQARAPAPPGPPPAVRRRVRVVVLVGMPVALALTGLLPTAPPTGRTALLVAALAVGSGVAERWASLSVRVGPATYNLTLSEMPLVIGLFILPGEAAALVAARVLGVLLGLGVLQRQDRFRLAFNVTSLWLETLLAVAVFGLVTPAGVTDGARVSAAALALAATVSLWSAVSISAVSWITGSGWRVAIALRAVRETLVPSVTTCSGAVLGLAVAETSPWLLWAPLLVTGALLLAHKAHLRMLRSGEVHGKLLEVTGRVTGDDDLATTAADICDAARRVMDTDLVGIRLPEEEGVSAGSPRWVGVDAEEATALDQALADVPPGGEAVVRDGDAELHLAPLEALPGGWLAMRLDEATVDEHDRSAVALLANHAGVALANAARGQALVAQARAASHDARHDALTGLPNRTTLRDALQVALAGGEPFGLLLIDLDDFKEINDALGHAVGDRVLVEVTRRLLPAGSPATVVARLGGDEFAALVPGGEATCRELASRIGEAIAEPVTVGPYDVEVGSSIGIATAPDHGTDPDELLKHADLAMYEAKAAGGGVAVFGAEAAGRAVRQLAISSGFKAAVQAGDLEVVYQPIVSLADGALVAVEALSRWTHPELGPIRPDEFVRVAEQAGLVTDLTHHVLEDALAWQRRWAAIGLDAEVSVNLSARSLGDDELSTRIARQLDRHGVPPGRLTLELTESSVIADPDRTSAVLQRLAAVGVRIAIDDFGTGYSSLAYLARLPAHEVKIDRSFVQPIVADERAATVVAAILRLCRDLGFEVVAEGIETGAAAAALRRAGCGRGQGYHLARPMDPWAVGPWEAARRGATPLTLIRP